MPWPSANHAVAYVTLYVSMTIDEYTRLRPPRDKRAR